MKKGSVRIKLASAVVASTMLATSYMGDLYVQAANKEVGITNEECSVDETKDLIDNVVQLDNDKFNYSEKDIDQITSQLDITELQEFYDKNGLGEITKDDFKDSIVRGIENVNNEIKSGELEVLENGTIVESDDDELYLQGGSTYDRTYWWGKRRYKSTSAAKKWAYLLNGAAAVNAGASLIGGAAFGAYGALPNGMTSVYAWYLANDISYVNSCTSRGIKADLWWCLYFEIRKQ